MRKNRMYACLRLRRIKIELHAPILPRNVSLPLHLHTPQLRRRILRHPVPRPKVITRIQKAARHNQPDNHALQNHRPSRTALVATTSAILVVGLWTHESNTSLFLVILTWPTSAACLTFSGTGFTLSRTSGLRGHVPAAIFSVGGRARRARSHSTLGERQPQQSTENSCSIASRPRHANCSSHMTVTCLNRTVKTTQDTAAVLTLLAGHKIADLIFRLEKYAVISGRVTDEEGGPVRDASVAVRKRILRKGKTTFGNASQSETNDLREYRIYDIAPGHYVISATPDEHRFQTVSTSRTMTPTKITRLRTISPHRRFPEPQKSN